VEPGVKEFSRHKVVLQDLEMIGERSPEKNGPWVKKNSIFYLKINCVELPSKYREWKIDRFVLNEFFK